MARKQIETTLKTIDSEVKKKLMAIVLDKEIKYNDDDVMVTIKYSNTSLTLLRANDDYEIILMFDKNVPTKGTYHLKKEHLILDLDVETNKLEVTPNKIEIVYQLNDEKRTYTLKIEE